MGDSRPYVSAGLGVTGLRAYCDEGVPCLCSGSANLKGAHAVSHAVCACREKQRKWGESAPGELVGVALWSVRHGVGISLRLWSLSLGTAGCGFHGTVKQAAEYGVVTVAQQTVEADSGGGCAGWVLWQGRSWLNNLGNRIGARAAEGKVSEVEIGSQ